MVKNWFILGVAMLVCTLASCGGNGTSEMKVDVIFDNAAPRTMPLDLFGNVPDSLVEALAIQEGIPASVSTFLVQKEGKQILFDAGNGTDDSRLLPRLEELGIAPQDIDYIFLTHLHGDHIGGLTKEGKKVFTQAQLYIPTVELDAWTQRADGTPKNVSAMVEAYQGSLVKFSMSDELPCGVKAIPAFGHTPGHTLYQIDDVLIAGDIMHGVALQAKYPEFSARYDMDKEQAVTSRKAVLEKVAREGLKMYGMHFPTTEPVELER